VSSRGRLFARHIAPLLALALYVCDVVPLAGAVLRSSVERAAREARGAWSANEAFVLLLAASHAGGQGRASSQQGAGEFSALDAPSTEVYNPRPHPFTDIEAPAELPRTFLDTRYDPAGVALTWANDELLVEQGSQSANWTYLQGKIDTAATLAGHTRLRLPNGFLSFAPVWRKNTQGQYWLYVEWENLAVAEGTRVTPADMTNAPVFHARGALTFGEGHCMQFDRQANRIRIMGVKCTCVSGQSIYDLLTVEPKESSIEYSNDIAQINEWIILDRILVQGNDAGSGATGQVRNGVRLDAQNSALIDSYVHQIGWAGTESHAVIAFNTPGPLKFVNNFMEGTSCCFFLGGVTPAYGAANGRPSDVEFRRNECTRRLSWCPEDPSYDGQTGRGIKNSLETKNVIRILIEGNIIANTWASAQQGMLCVIKSGEGISDATGQGSEDLTLRYNIAHDGVIAWNFQGIDDLTAINAKRCALYHNLAYNIGTFAGAHRAFFCTHKFDDLYIRFNTVVQNAASDAMLFADPGIGNGGFVGLADNFTFCDNLFGAAYLAMSSGSNHIAAVAEYADTYTFERNVIVESDGFAGLYNGTTQHPANWAAVGFVNLAGGDHRLASGSTFKGDGFDGADPGAHIDDVELATSGVES
jgi:hypothetical protein